jgi:hypothetical protein
MPKRDEILAAAAKAKAETGKYRQVAHRFHLTPKQLEDLVGNNRADFDNKIIEFKKLKITS